MIPAAPGSARARRARWLGVALLAFVAAAPPAASGHTRGLSYSSWVMDEGGATVRARVSRLDWTRLGLDPAGSSAHARAAARYLAEHLRLVAGATPCPPDGEPTLLRGPEGWVVYGWRVECAASGPRALEGALLLRVAPSHLHFTRATLAGGGVVDAVLSAAEPRFDLPGAPPHPGDAGRGERPSGAARGGVAGYLVLGLEHILSGWDHLAFVLALLLLAATLGEIAALVTAFTLAHSTTLALATLGWAQPQPAPVEALIGFSIALVAAENAWILGGRDRLVPLAFAAGLLALAALGTAALSRAALLGLGLFSLCHFALLRSAEQPGRLRVAVAFAFGLVHGFGFAGVLAQLELPTALLIPALFGFNCGVELGQLAVVAASWPVLHWLREHGGSRLAAELGSAGICGLGLYWFLTRALGGDAP